MYDRGGEGGGEWAKDLEVRYIHIMTKCMFEFEFMKGQCVPTRGSSIFSSEGGSYFKRFKFRYVGVFLPSCLVKTCLVVLKQS